MDQILTKNKVSSIVFFVLCLSLNLQYVQLGIPKLKIISYLLFSLLLMIWILRCVNSEVIAVPKNKTIMIVSVLFLWKLLSLMHTIFISQGVKNILDTFVIIMLAFFIIPSMFKYQEFLKLVFYSILIVSIISIIGSYFVVLDEQFYREGVGGVTERYRWLFVHPNSAGLFGVILFISSVSLWKVNYKKWNILYIFGIILSVILVSLSISRTSIIVIIVFLSLYFGNKYMDKKSFYSKFYIYLVVLSVGFILIALNLDFFSVENLNTISSTRLRIWTTVVNDMDNKLIGEGLFQPGKNLVYSVEKNGYGLDGLFINIFYDEGLIGIIIFAVFLLHLMFLLLKADSKKHYSSTTAIPILLIALFYSVTETHFFINNLFTILVLGSIGYIISKKNVIKFN